MITSLKNALVYVCSGLDACHGAERRARRGAQRRGRRQGHCRPTLTLALLAGLASACGADVKSAADVASIFSGDAVGLQEKLADLCSVLRQRKDEPTLQGSSLPVDGCNQAGLAALNLTGLDKFAFLGLDDGKPTGSDKVIHFSLRAELWLNKSLLDLAGVVAAKLKQGGGKGLLDQQDAVGKPAGPLVLKVNILEEPAIDVDNLHFNMKLNFKGSGIADIDNTMVIGGQLLQNKVAVHVRTTEDMPYEKSLLKNAEALITVIPHAGDLYVDALIDANLYSPFGVADDAFKSRARDMLSGLLAPALNSLLNLKPGG